jgi:hypothetical protein
MGRSNDLPVPSSRHHTNVSVPLVLIYMREGFPPLTTGQATGRPEGLPMPPSNFASLQFARAHQDPDVTVKPRSRRWPTGGIGKPAGGMGRSNDLPVWPIEKHQLLLQRFNAVQPVEGNHPLQA